MKPAIGITQCLDDRGRWRKGRTYGYLDTSYADAIERAGGLPVMLPVQSDVTSVVERIDGLLLPGGDDFAPPADRTYPADVRFDVAPKQQLAFDAALLGAVRGRGLPVLGICYGMQLMALHCGGALLYDVATDAPDAKPHQLDESGGRHEVAVEPGTLLAEAIGAGTHPVNSLHHQAVVDPGQGQSVSARAPDGIVEAIESGEAEPAGFVLGVQWHPEKMAGAASDGLFEAFVRACVAARSTR